MGLGEADRLGQLGRLDRRLGQLVGQLGSVTLDPFLKPNRPGESAGVVWVARETECVSEFGSQFCAGIS